MIRRVAWNRNDLTGRRFGRLVVTVVGPVIDRGPEGPRGGVRGSLTWWCVCDCGVASLKRSFHLVSGKISSCSNACRLGVVPLADRLWSRVDKNGPVPDHRPHLGPCWLWTGSSDARGYGKISTVGGEPQRTHRVSFFLTHGRWPTPFALHHCDNPPCVRPDHLFEGDQTANMIDMASKNRWGNQTRTSKAS